MILKGRLFPKSDLATGEFLGGFLLKDKGRLLKFEPLFSLWSRQIVYLKVPKKRENNLV
jgi:hypothetical protein